MSIKTQNITDEVVLIDCIKKFFAKAYVCATPDEQKLLYFACEKKGHKGIKRTLIEDFQGIPVHDHESTLYKYGNAHQECLAHVQQYLKRQHGK